MRTTSPRGPAASFRVGACAAGCVVLAALAAAPTAAAAVPETLSSTEGYGLVRDLASGDRGSRRRAAGRLIEARDESLVPGLVDALFFIPRKDRGLTLNVLEALTGEKRGSRYLDWVEYVGSRTDLEPKVGYAGFKGSLFERIDPRFRSLLHDGAPARIRLEEVVWGGVRFEGIPALDRPRHVPAAEAGYLLADELVFGVAVGGEHRAYPRRILSWHEMANDLVGGEPVTLSFCTLCDSAVLYSGRLASGEVLTFGTSGLLYRSNKLMVDRATGTLWSNLLGEAVVGPLAALDADGEGSAAGAPARLEVLPLTLTTWAEWHSLHPETTVLALDPELGRRWGFDYSPGAADRAREGVSFPIWRKSGRLDPKAEVYALRVGGAPKAYPVERLEAEGVVNDTVGGEPVVLVTDPGSGAVRAYRRGGHRFRWSEDGALVDGQDRPWRQTETGLEPPAGAVDLEPLPRLPGHVTFWFGWFGFFPETEVYGSGG
ncbi:MAG TPA: DUF3179 domain-containing protein [Thermoanaerobaculia bacterium]|nr:DUF3179 domain-containing protein [Thermoanaerobaculia bacterium]